MRRLPFLSKSDRRALLALEWVIIIVVLVASAYSWREAEKANGLAVDSVGVQRHDASPSRIRRSSARHSYVYAVPEVKVETFPFDPNTADSTTLLRLGLAPFQVRSIYRYRAAGGRYHTPDDFKHLYRLTHEQWERLRPMIRIDRRYQYLSEEEKRTPTPTAQAGGSLRSAEGVASVSMATDSSSDSPACATPARDTVRFPVKLALGTLVDANRADTNLLKKIPGIASYRARKIVEYRDRLGGFVRIEQVMEACEMPDEVLDWFELCEPIESRRININTASVQRMMRHPYITFYQARDISEYRKKRGTHPIVSTSELVEAGIFTHEQAELLLPYLEY